MKKILHVITNYNGRGGAERMLNNIIVNDVENRHYLLSLLDLNEKLYANLAELDHVVLCEPLDLKRKPFKVFFKIIRTVLFIRKNDINVVCSWMYHANLFCALMYFFCFGKVNLVWNIRHSLDDLSKDGFSTKVAIFFSRILSFVPRKVIFNSCRSLTQHCEYGFWSRNMVYIPNGVDLFKFKPLWSYKPGDNVSIGALGRNHRVKNFESLIIAFSKIKHEYATLTLKGANCIGLIGLVDDLGLSKRVFIEDEDEDVMGFFGKIDLFVLSSFSEGFPNVLCEAMASDIPCVTTNVGDAQQIVGGGGFFIDGFSPEKIAEAIDSAICELEHNKIVKFERFYRIQKEYSLSSAIDRFSAIFTN